MAMTPRFSIPASSSKSSSKRTTRIDPGVGGFPSPSLSSSASVENETIESGRTEQQVVESRIGAAAAPSESRSSQLHYVPETYEPNYCYPLLVWLTIPGQEFDLAATMDSISDRNYLGLQIDLGQLFDSSVDPNLFVRMLHTHQLTLQKAIRNSVAKFRREYKVHSERIYLAGIEQGAVAALQLGLSRPEWFGGVLSINAGVANIPHLLNRFRDLQGMRILLAHGRGIPCEALTSESTLARMLYAAGMRVCRRAYATTTPRTAQGRISHLSRDIDRWVMQDIAQAQLQ